MYKSIGLLLLAMILQACMSQAIQSPDTLVGGPCEDCEAAIDFQLLSQKLQSVDTLPGYTETTPKLKISGTVYKADGKKLAPNIILYLYHTNREGIYEPSEKPMGWEKRHGKHRGWLQTDAEGKYTFYTFRPAPYPNMQEPEHIHIYVKEPDLMPYYIDNYVFLGDSLLKEEDIQAQKERGSSGLVRLTEQNGIWVGKRDIVLGLNIPNYKE